MKSWGLAAAVLVGHSLRAACTLVPIGQTARIALSPPAPSCVRIVIAPGEAAQFSVDQPFDLTLRVIGGAHEVQIDGFEFGSETVTLTAAADYRIYASPVQSPGNTRSTLSVAVRMVSLPRAASWQKAEILATESKRSKKDSDIGQSLIAWQEMGQVSEVARTMLKEGSAALRRDSLEARASFEKALDACRTISDVRCAAEAANNSGLASLRLGELELASRRLQEAAEDWHRLSYPVFEGRTLSNLGVLFRASGDYQRAIEVFSRAGTLLSGRDVISHARLLNNLGVCYQYLAEFEKSAALFQSALVRFVRHQQPREALRARLNLGRTLMLQGQLGRAQALLEQALAEAVIHSDASGRADILNNLGQVLLKRSRPDEARTRLMEALEAQRALRSRRGEAIALHNLGIEANQRDDLTSARRFLADAAEIRASSGLRDDASESFLALAEVAYRAGDLVAARGLAERAVRSIELLRSGVSSLTLRASFYSRKRAFFDLLVDISMAAGTADGPSDALLAAEQGRARALLDLLVQGPLAGRLSSQLLKRRWDLEREISFLASRLTTATPAQEGDVRGRLHQVSKNAEVVDADIVRAFESQDIGRALPSVQDLYSGGLPSDSALLEYHLGERASYLWLVQGGKIQTFRLPPRSVVEPLAARTTALFAALKERQNSPRSQAEFEWGLRRLSRILLGPLEGTKLPPRLILVLDGPLNRTPMGALVLPRGSALGLSHDVVQAPSAAFLLAGRPPRAPSEYPRSVLAVADPVYSADDPRVVIQRSSSPPAGDPGLARLPFVEDLKTIASLIPSSRFLFLQGFRANPATLRQVRIEDFGIVHFSTHAVIDERAPELSRVVLSLVDSGGRPIDGFLRPPQFAQLPLNGSTVVLSSCETALGKLVIGEGLRGFSHSLFEAGASQLVLSLAKTDAVASSAFFSEFYRHVLGRRSASVEHALTLARRHLSTTSTWSDPYYWAAFTVIGRPSSSQTDGRPGG